MRITKIGVTTAVDTTLPDKYCKPYDGRVYGSDGRLTQPMSTDWHIIRYQVVTNGERGQTVEVTRGVGAGVTNDHAVFTSIGSAANGVHVWLEDYAGNTSEEVYVNNCLNVSVSSESSTVQAGTTAQFTATVKNFSKTDKVTWSISGSNSPETKIDANGVLTVKATSALDEMKFDTAVVNVTAKAKYTVTVICGEHGKVTPGSGEYYEGTEVEYTFTPDAHYKLDKVLVNGQEVTVKDNKGTLTVTTNATLEASFKPIMHTVEVEAGEHGKVTPGTGEYAEGSEVTFTVEADKGYEVSKVTVNGKDVTLKNGKFTVVINGKTAVKATFKAIKNPTTGDGFTRCSPSCWPSPHWPPLPQPSCSCAKSARTEPADAG